MKRTPRLLLPLLIVLCMAVTLLSIFVPFGESTAPGAIAVNNQTGHIAVAYFDESADSSVIAVFDPTGKQIAKIKPNYKESIISVVHFDETGNLRFYLPVEGHYYTVTPFGDILSYYTADRVDGTAYDYTILWTLTDTGTYQTAAAGLTYIYTPTDIADRMCGRRDTLIVRNEAGKETTLWTSAD